MLTVQLSEPPFVSFNDSMLNTRDLPLFLSVDRLSLWCAEWQVDSDMQVLEGWNVTRKEQGRRLTVIESGGCDEGARPLILYPLGS